jgi:ribonuclease HII
VRSLKPPSSRLTNPARDPRLAPEITARAAGFRRIAGVDEAGRGPWAGPVVAAAVVVRATRLPVRIDDSKRLTQKQREQAFPVILEHAEVGIGVVCAEAIDQHNILRATCLAMQEAIQDLARPPDLILVDGPRAPDVPMPCWPLIRGDQRSHAIGCASIIAKVVRDRLMAFYHELDPRYAFNRHKGYGTALHAMRLKDHGPSVFHRRSFRPIRDGV